jgi:protein involved in polysaccharide export with SLBB domain
VGGVTRQGSVRLIEIREQGSTVQVVDLFKFLRQADTAFNPVLKEGQIVHVPPRYMRASSVGELRKSGTFEIIPGETAADLIEFSGGFATTADTAHILIERVNPGSEATNIAFSSSNASAITLDDLDVLVVPDLVSLHGIEPVEVFGGGGREGPFQVAQSERLSDFVMRLWRFTPRFNVESAVIERYVPDGDAQYIYFNVREVLRGDSLGDTVLRPGDMISFPPRENQVFVTGEVVLPGSVPFLPGYTAERYVALAGGPNDAGTYDKIDIFAVDGSLRSGDRHSPVYRGETIVVKQKLSKTLASWFYGAATVTGLMLSIYAVTQ